MRGVKRKRIKMREKTLPLPSRKDWKGGEIKDSKMDRMDGDLDEKDEG